MQPAGIKMTRPLRGLAFAVAMAAALTASADIKYWDNPDFRAFDVGDYVPGAVWNYDGIRNVGATADHDPHALTWVNLGSAGANNNVFLQKATGNNSWGSVSAAELEAGTYGNWTENGFIFKGNSRMRCETGRIDAGSSYSLQLLVDAQSARQSTDGGYVMSVSSTHFAMCINKTAGKLYWLTKMAYNDSHNTSFLSGDSFEYATAIVNGGDNTTALFDGTAAPTSGDGFRQYSSVSGHSESKYAIGCTLASGNAFVGTLKFFRYYNRALSNEEVAWNRVVDEARFFGRQAPIPVTNVVVASQIPFVNADQPNGCYAVDAGGFSFTAPASKVVRRRTYVCSGYTIETWDGGMWGTPVAHDGETSYTATDGALVRLTWLWTAGDGLVTYDIDDYVWDGLEVFFDGINNVGRDLPHSTTTVIWKNLGSKGSVNDVFIQRLNAAGTAWGTAANLDKVGGRDPGEWIGNGFVMRGESRFRCNSPGGFTVGKNYSLQMLVDAKASDQTTTYAYLLGGHIDNFSFRLEKSSGTLYWRVGGGSWSHPYMTGGSYAYMTAIMKDTEDTDTQTFFSGTTIPASGTGYKTYSAVGYSDTGYCLGGYGKEAVSDRFTGTFKSFRQYGRALTPAEVEQNRAVDNWRFFHEPVTANVVVATTNPNLQGNDEEGAYEVVGSYTFTTPASATAKGIAYTNDGYTVETWSAAGGWGTATAHTGTSYSYSTAAGTVRLTWRWKAVHGLRTAADYTFDDYSQAGLVVNYDGILNAGRHLAHTTNKVAWANLGSAGAANDLFIQLLNEAGTEWTTATGLAPVAGREPGEWTEKGFVLKGDSRFRTLGPIGPVSSWTIQSLVDADIADIGNDSCSYVLSVSWNKFSLVLSKSGLPRPNSFYFNTQGADYRPNFQNESGKYSYATAILDASDKTAKMFLGTTIPTSGDVNDGFHQFGSVSPFTDSAYCIGGYGKNDVNQLFNGTLKSIRYYDRALTHEEIVRNRNVDAARYFGALGVTNLVVAVEPGVDLNATPAPGTYFVEGSYDFSVAPGNDTPVGYKLQAWNGTRWVTVARREGVTFHYDAETAPAAKMRIVWAKTNPFLFVVR